METALSQPHALQGLISLSDEVWNLLHIQMCLGIKESAAQSLVNEYGFPKPIVNEKRNRRWLAEDVKSHLKKKSSGEVFQPKKHAIKPMYEPKVVSFKKAN